MKLRLTLLALAPLLACSPGCFLAAAAGAGFIVSNQVQNGTRVAEVKLDVDHVWPSVKETMGFFQEPGSSPTVQDFPRSVTGRVNGATVLVVVEAIDIDRTTIRVSAEKFMNLTKDEGTANYVMQGILDRLHE